MSTLPAEQPPSYRLTLRSADAPIPSLHDLSTFLFDFTILYEISRLAADPKYIDAPLPRIVRYRRASYLREEDRLRTARLRVQSPIDLVVALPATSGAATALFTAWAGVASFLSIIPDPVYYSGAAIVALKALANTGKVGAEAVKALTAAGKDVADSRKSLAEGEKARAEARKLLAEAAKMDVETAVARQDLEDRRSIAPLVAAESSLLVVGLSDEERGLVMRLSGSLEHRAVAELSRGLEATAGIQRSDVGELLEEVLALLEARGATAIYGQALQRLANSRVRIAEISITLARDEERT